MLALILEFELLIPRLYEHLVAGRAECGRAHLEGRIRIMKLSEACSIEADGRAFQEANSKAESVISRA